MEKQIGIKNYIRTEEHKLHLIISVISWCLVLFFIFYRPNLTFEKDREYLTLKGDEIQSFMTLDKGDGFKLYKNDKFYSTNDKLRPIAGYLFDKNKVIVDDEKGNRFAILVNNLSSYPKDLRILNHKFKYVYNRKDLNGKLLKDIINEAGDYTLLDKKNRIIVFPQIVLFNGAERTKGVALVYDENERVIQTGVWESPRTNLYTHIPYYDKIASLNLFAKIQRFTQENDYEPKFFGETISAICWYIFDLITSPFVIIIILGAIFYSIYPLLYKLSKLSKIPNYLIYILAYLLMPVMLLFYLAILFYYNDIWIWTAISGISYFVYTVLFIHAFTPASVRCSKCHKMNCIDVVETEYLYKKDVISEVGSTWREGEYEPKKKAQEKLYIRTHFFEKCLSCGHINEYDSKSTRLEKMKDISEIECPECGKYTLEVGSLLVKNDLHNYRWSSTKKGDIKEKEYLFFDSDFVKKDVTTYYSQISGSLTYKLICRCNNCDYQYSEEYKKNINGKKNIEGTKTKTTTYTRI